MKTRHLLTVASLAASLACGEGGSLSPGASSGGGESGEVEIAGDPDRNAYFGDLHVHTNYSFDAFLMGTRRNPDEAYEFAKGGAIEHASGFIMQMKKPLDFQAVADHAFYLGMMPALADESGP